MHVAQGAHPEMWPVLMGRHEFGEATTAGDIDVHREPV
jgi:hypothetical protein